MKQRLYFVLRFARNTTCSVVSCLKQRRRNVNKQRGPLADNLKKFIMFLEKTDQKLCETAPHSKLRLCVFQRKPEQKTSGFSYFHARFGWLLLLSPKISFLLYLQLSILKPLCVCFDENFTLVSTMFLFCLFSFTTTVYTLLQRE